MTAFAPILFGFLAVLCEALAEITNRITYAALAAALVFAVGQLSAGAPTGQTVDTVGWVVLALVVGRLGFTTARTLLADPGADPRAVTA